MRSPPTLLLLAFLGRTALGAPSSSSAASPPRPSGVPRTDYEVIVVGGGPSGLSALSGLARVHRHALLIDSGVYRNSQTRRVHDVSLEQYHTVNMTNGTVTRIDMARNSFTVHADLPGRQGQAVTSRKVVLGTGIRDLVPDTPGLRENWARGIYWCPWCDGHEHAGQPLGLLSTLDEIPSMVREIYTLNNDLVAFVNGSDTPPNRAALQQENAQWQVYLALQNVTVVNATLESIERLRGEAVATGPQPTGPAPDDDLFRVHVAGGASFERSAIFTNFPKQQASMVGPQMGVRLEDVSMVSDPERGLMTNIDGVYAVGDANSDSSTNVPHALYSGKKAAVYIHLQLSKDEAQAEVDGGSQQHEQKQQRRSDLVEEARAVWKRSNDERGSVLYAGEFDERL